MYRSFAGKQGITIPARRGAKLKTLCQQLAVGFAAGPAPRGRALALQHVPVGRRGAHAGHGRAVLARRPPRRSPAARVSLRCEVVAVGTELLLGQVVDTNSSWIGEQLALSGIDSHFQTKVGDNRARIVSVLRLALDRSDAVIVCGGLGPTHDDITRECIAEVMGVGLERDEAIADHIREMFESRGRRMADNNLRQADVPVGASIIPQRRGTAPGLICPVGDKVIYAVPGVPHEMKEMLERAIVPDLRIRSGDTAVIVSRTLRTWGESESGLAEILAPLIERLDTTGNPTLAFLASGIEGLKVRLTAKAGSEEAARALLAVEEPRCARPSDGSCSAPTTRTWRAPCCRSCARRAALWRWPSRSRAASSRRGSPRCRAQSDVFRGSVVSYATGVKQHILGVPEGPVVSEEAAMAMAEGACRVMDADVGLALTGVAGPTEQDGQPVGTLFVGLCIDGAVRGGTPALAGRPRSDAAVRRPSRRSTSCGCVCWIGSRSAERASLRRGLASRRGARRDRVTPAPRAARCAVDGKGAVACHPPLPRRGRRNPWSARRSMASRRRSSRRTSAPR